jgi:hypothetical protein
MRIVRVAGLLVPALMGKKTRGVGVTDPVRRTVQQWATLSREALTAKVSAVVHQPPADPTRFWGAVREDVVLAAAVRGVLAGLLRDKQGSRDENFWAYRIASARAALDGTAAAAPSAPAAPAPASAEPAAPAGNVGRKARRPATPEPVLDIPHRVAPSPSRPAIPAVEFLAP